jgi:hypothetical protein
MKSSYAWRGLVWSVLAFAFGLAVYRANTQTVAHDEALEYEWYLDGGVEHVLHYNPTNHVLFTLFAKPLVWFLGNRELILRSPSLFGAVIYLLTSYLLCRRLFGRGVLFFFAVAMLALNPQILDFMAAARGYILGLAGLVAAMYLMARLAEHGEFDPTDAEWKWGCILASISLALSVAGNLTNVVPAACLVFTFSAASLGGLRKLRKISDPQARQFAKYFLFPGAATGFCILWPYLIQARPWHFYAGRTSASDAIRDTFQASFLYRWTDDVFASLGAVPSAPGSWQERVTNLGEYLFLPALFVLVAAGFFLAWRARPESASKQNVQCRIFAGAAIASVVLIVALHAAAGVHYPDSRLCLFQIPLFTVGAMLAGREIHFRFPSPFLKTLGLLLAAIVIADYALSLQTKSFRYNAYDVISRELYEAIANDARSRHLANVRVGGTWWYEPEINYYRRRYKAEWMLEYEIKDRSYGWQTPNSLVPADYDYFVFTPAGDPGLAASQIRTIYHDELRHITIVAISH